MILPLDQSSPFNGGSKNPPAPELIYIRCHFNLAFIRPIRSNLKYTYRVWVPVGNPESFRAGSH